MFLNKMWHRSPLTTSRNQTLTLRGVTALLNQQYGERTKEDGDAEMKRETEAQTISISILILLIFLSIFMPIQHVEKEILFELRRREEDGEMD